MAPEVELRPLRAARFRFCMVLPDHIAKFLTIGFYPNEKGYWVECPYVEAPGKVVLTKFTKTPSDTDWEAAGAESRVSSSILKLSHHADGRVHFSKDGHAYTTVHTVTNPLEAMEGLAFLFQAQGIDRFKRQDPSGKGSWR